MMTWESIFLLRNEIFVSLMILLVLVLKLFEVDKRTVLLLRLVNWLLLVNLLISLIPTEPATLFSGFFRTSALVGLEKGIINFGVLLISLLATKWFHRHSDLVVEFFVLMLSSLVGTYLMISSGHVLMLYLGIEMSTIPIAALSNFHKYERRSSEAGIKFILSSAFSTGILLYGISMLYGAYGNLDYDFLRATIRPDLLTTLGFAFIMGGLFFKMSAVPFHLWTADVYEGSPIPVTNYLSVISKGAIVFVFVSVLVTVFENIRGQWQQIITLAAILSMTVGNLFAMRQKNLKRFMAFSSISQVGFILVGVTGYNILSLDSTVYFMLIYMLSNVVCFGVIGAVADTTRKENMDVIKGLYKTNPTFGIVFSIALFSLAGIPPTSGFFGKLLLLTSSMSSGMYVLVAVAGLNMVLSLYNYLRIIRRIFFDKPEVEFKVIRTPLMMATLISASVAIVLVGYIPYVYSYVDSIVRALFE